MLIYTNSKAGRLDRRLHIITATANVVTAWLARISTLRPDRHTAYLFSQVHQAEPHADNHFKAGAFGVFFPGVGRLDPRVGAVAADPLEPRGRHRPTRRGRLLAAPHLRSTTRRCRHPVDVLAALLDHQNVAITQGYYRVGPTPKREAIERVGALVMDRRGAMRPAADRVEYERRSVSTLLGGCVEPSNVKSGGQSCPIRFQCGGCDHYRPDPSYIQEIEQEIRKIKADVLEAQLCAAPQVVDNLRYNLAMFEGILAKMTGNLEQLNPPERAGLDAAIGTIRRARELHRNALPLFVVDHQTQDNA